MEGELGLINNIMGSPVESTNEAGSFGSLGAFLNRVRQMDAKKLHQLASNSRMMQNVGISLATTDDETVREKAFEVVYGGSRENKEKSKEKSNMCFVVDAHERRIRCVNREEQKQHEQLLISLEDISDEQFSRFGKTVKENEVENSDNFVHCDKCSAFYELCCIEHPLYQCQDRVPLTNSPTENDDRAASTLPAFLYIQNSSIPNAGKGVFTKVDIPTGILFGPYEGILTQNHQEIESSGYAWELRAENENTSYYIDAKDPRYSNWMRYINSPRNESEQNLIAFQYQGSVYYRVFKPIDRSTELLVWYGKRYGKELGIVDNSIKRVPRAFVFYSGKSPYVL